MNFKFLYFLSLVSLSIQFQPSLNSLNPYKSLNRNLRGSLITTKMSLLNRSNFIYTFCFYGAVISYPLYIKNEVKKELKKEIKNSYENKQIEIFKNTASSVCFISTDYSTFASKFNGNKNGNNIDIDNIPKGVGSGFIWDDKGHIVTNFHVINKVSKALITIDNTTYNAKITGIDPDKDIAVLKIDINETNKNKKLPNPITIGNINDIVVGQYSYAIGNPFGQDHSFTFGIISGLNREFVSPTGRKIKGIIQTDADINPGNSGGPLLNSKGEIIGMNTATFGSGTSAGIGFAIPINTITEVVNEIIEKGSVEKAIIGISFLERLPTPFECKTLGIPELKRGVVVLSVPTNSSTGLIGIKKIGEKKVVLGDVIIGIDNYEINNPEDLVSILEKYKPNDKVNIRIIRNQVEIVLPITLTTYKTKSYTNMEIDVPLGNIAPQITPKLN